MKKVVGLGACVYDTLISCNKYPKEDSKQSAQNIFLSGGGPVGNALVVASKLGVDAEIIGALANDDAGKYLIKDFNKYGVETKNIKVIDDTRSFTSYIILSQDSKTRTCVFDRGNVPDDPQNIALSVIKNADVLHFDGNYIKSAICAAKFAREHGVTTSLDAGGLYNGIEYLLPNIDILIPSAEFALNFTGVKSISAAIEVLQNRYNPKVLAVTDGSNGGYYYESGTVKHYAGIKVNAIDTNGAGDTFHGAFIAAYLMGKSVCDCCKFASVVAAYKCTQMGARDYPLSLEIIEKILSNKFFSESTK